MEDEPREETLGLFHMYGVSDDHESVVMPTSPSPAESSLNLKFRPSINIQWAQTELNNKFMCELCTCIIIIIHREGEEFVSALHDQWVAADCTVFAAFKNFIGYQSDDDSEQIAGFDQHGEGNISADIATGHEDKEEWVTEDEDGSVENEYEDGGTKGNNEDNGVDSAVEDDGVERNAE
ncbi:hypothetical protein OH76DRAFT_1490709 [Lentinus brumalis]|uniref:Uncharacterized protein n=1 Tax=Lentinus brumalis TaxID=2498619 RepID=A0A371CI31_9APHY|nr:hypothetical protein OH76DRAFT_1490709 [Polyporus brumalis]